MSPAVEITTSPMASTMVATTVPSSDKACKRLGPPCPFCAQSAPHPSLVDSDWSEEDWDRDIEGKRKTKKGRGGKAKTDNRRTRENIELLSSKPHI